MTKDIEYDFLSDMSLDFLGDNDDDSTRELRDLVSSIPSVAVVLKNELPQPMVVEVTDLRATINEVFLYPKSLVQLIVPNIDASTSDICPHFKIVMESVTTKIPINFKLLTFFKRYCGVPAFVSARCHIALIVGLYDHIDNQLISVPHAMTTNDITIQGDLRIFMPYPPHAQYQLLSPCDQCQYRKVKCSQSLLCGRCGGDCRPSKQEVFTRATTINRVYMSGSFQHVDLARYHIYLQCCHYHMPIQMMRTEVKDMTDRLKLLPGVGKENVCTPLVVEDLPPVLLSIINANQTHKVEWLYKGAYSVTTSPSYAANFATPISIIKVSHDVKCPPKLVDTMNCAQYDIPLKIWLESAANPSRVVVFTGKLRWDSDGVVSMSTIRMITYIVEYDKIIVVTTASRGLSIML